MVTRLIRNRRCLVVRLHKRVEVRTHVGETIGVFVQQGGRRDRIERSGGRDKRTTLSTTQTLKHWKSWVRGVVTVFARKSLVTDSEEQALDGMRETDVVLLWRVNIARVETARRSCLHLLDKNIARSTGHALTLIVRHNSVVSPHRH